MNIWENIMTGVCILSLLLMFVIAVGSSFCRSVDELENLSDEELLERYRFMKDHVDFDSDYQRSEFSEVINEIRRRDLTLED